MLACWETGFNQSESPWYTDLVSTYIPDFNAQSDFSRQPEHWNDPVFTNEAERSGQVRRTAVNMAVACFHSVWHFKPQVYTLHLLTSKYVGAATFCSAVCLQTKIFKNAASWGVTDRVKGFITRQCVSVTEKHIGRNAVIRQWQDNIHWTGFVLRSDTGLKNQILAYFYFE